MKLIIDRNQIDSTPEQFLRRAGYGYIRDRRSGSDSFVRRLGSGFYPRLHMYVKENSSQIIFDLHLDQKQPSYAGSRMHNAEHDSETVEGEIVRLKNFIAQKSEQAAEGRTEKEDELIDKIGGDRNYKNIKKEEKKSWWKFW
jgi:hypothetical protein